MADEKTTFGVVIENPSPPTTAPPPLSTNNPYCQQPLRPIPSNNTLSPVSDPEESRTPSPAVERDASNPFSAFYNHDTPRRSLQEHSKTNLDVYHHDLEGAKGSTAAISQTTTQPKISVDGRVMECSAWPSKQTLREKAKAAKRERQWGCNPMRNLNEKQKLWAKIVIALLVIGAAVGVGIGVSKAVGGGVWAGNGQSRQIDGDSKR